MLRMIFCTPLAIAFIIGYCVHNCSLVNKVALGNIKELPQDGGRADFAKESPMPLPFIDLLNDITSSQIHLEDSTFKESVLLIIHLVWKSNLPFSCDIISFPSFTISMSLLNKLLNSLTRRWFFMFRVQPDCAQQALLPMYTTFRSILLQYRGKHQYVNNNSTLLLLFYCTFGNIRDNIL